MRSPQTEVTLISRSLFIYRCVGRHWSSETGSSENKPCHKPCLNGLSLVARCKIFAHGIKLLLELPQLPNTCLNVLEPPMPASTWNGRSTVRLATSCCALQQLSESLNEERQLARFTEHLKLFNLTRQPLQPLIGITGKQDNFEGRSNLFGRASPRRPHAESRRQLSPWATSRGVLAQSLSKMSIGPSKPSQKAKAFSAVPAAKTSNP